MASTKFADMNAYRKLYLSEQERALRETRKSRGLPEHPSAINWDRVGWDRANFDLAIHEVNRKDYFKKMYQGNWDQGVDDRHVNSYMWTDENGLSRVVTEAEYVRLKAERDGLIGSTLHMKQAVAQQLKETTRKNLDPIEALRARVLERLSDVELPEDLCHV